MKALDDQLEEEEYKFKQDIKQYNNQESQIQVEEAYHPEPRFYPGTYDDDKEGETYEEIMKQAQEEILAIEQR